MSSSGRKSVTRFAFDFSVQDLYETKQLEQLDRLFLSRLGESDPALEASLTRARNEPGRLDAKAESELLVHVAPHLEDFIADLFAIKTENGELQSRHEQLAPLWRVKRQFVQRRAATRIKPAEAALLDGRALEARLTKLLGGVFDELNFAKHVETWLADEANHRDSLQAASEFAAWAVHTPEGRQRASGGLLFELPSRVDPQNLLRGVSSRHDGDFCRHSIDPEHVHRRSGFELNDPGMSLPVALAQSSYCVLCHPLGTDSCSKGMREPQPKGGRTDQIAPLIFKKNEFGIAMTGCPMEERISEFLHLKTRGLAVAALAMIVVDNPTTAATGHRICNDCMKACIYQRQKQKPVDIPQVESRTLKDVLALPWGFEIYSLLTRWNPLNLRRPLPRAPSSRKVLVVGMGPAGITLAHHLLNDGHTVVGIDSASIDAIDPCLTGVAMDGTRVPFEGLRDIAAIRKPAGDRATGFGGTAEYGIVGSRWDKNNLTLLRLLLERRENFSLHGEVPLGKTFTLQNAWNAGFDHIALCAGAGQPTPLSIPGAESGGILQALDFLRELQVEGACREDSNTALEIRLPLLVIGGGLTAIDAATEALAYYPLQVERFLRRQENANAHQDRSLPTTADRGLWETYIEHARALRRERATAMKEDRPARILELLRSWGGVSIVYRRRLAESPAYTLNHEEVEKAFEEGIEWIDDATPLAVEADTAHRVCGLRVRTPEKAVSGNVAGSREATIPAATIIVAIGTRPSEAREILGDMHKAGEIRMNGSFMQPLDEQGNPLRVDTKHPKPHDVPVLLNRAPNDRFISFFGDMNPAYAGNVARALGSAKQGYPLISKVLARRAPANSLAPQQFLQTLDSRLKMPDQTAIPRDEKLSVET